MQRVKHVKYCHTVHAGGLILRSLQSPCHGQARKDLVQLLENVASGKITYVVMPNQAMAWKVIVRCYLAISLLTLAIGMGFYLNGLTLILPFSGLEVIALGLALYFTARQSGERELITISTDLIAIERGHEKPVSKNEFQRAWSTIVLERPAHHWYPRRLFIRSHGVQVEIGAFLNEQERQGLAEELQRAIRCIS